MDAGPIHSLLKSELLAECLFRADRFDDLEKLDAVSSKVRLLQGLACVRQGRLDDASDTFRQVLAGDPDCVMARNALVRLLSRSALNYARDTQWQAAASDLDHAQKLNGVSLILGGSVEAQAIIFIQAGRRPDAIHILEEAQRQDPSKATIAHSLGLAYYHTALGLEEQGQLDEADQAWRRVISNWAMILSQDELALLF